MWGHSEKCEKSAFCSPAESSQQNGTMASTLICLQNLRDKFLLFMKYSVCSILLEQPEWTETDTKTSQQAEGLQSWFSAPVPCTTVGQSSCTPTGACVPTPPLGSVKCSCGAYPRDFWFSYVWDGVLRLCPILPEATEASWRTADLELGERWDPR